MSYQAIHYRDRDGREPVNEVIDTLDEGCQDSIDWTIRLLNRLTDAHPNLPYPHSSALKGDKYRAFLELRTACGGTLYRIIVRRSDRFFIPLHILHKKTCEISEEDKKTALARWNDFKARMDGVPRRSPRAMGHDEP